MSKPDGVNWKQFERIVAAIEFATSVGAEVVWDEDIEGRQFDVAVRFSNGPHNYLTLIECKSHKKPLPVANVDAFATKARDARANKAVIVSASGFQSGCAAVARRHGVDLFRLNEHLKEPAEAGDVSSEPVVTAYDFVIHFPGKHPPLPIPESNNRLDYLLAHGSVKRGPMIYSLKELLDRFMEVISIPSEFDKPVEGEMPLGGAIMEIPTLLDVSPVSSVSFKMAKTMKKTIPMAGMDQHLALKMNTSFELIDCIAGQSVTTIDGLDLPIGFKTRFKVGHFYTNMLEQNYRCDALDNGKVELVLVEAYSHGHLIQARMSAKLDVSRYYVEVLDPKELIRLEMMYQRYCRNVPPRMSQS